MQKLKTTETKKKQKGTSKKKDEVPFWFQFL